MDNDDAIRALAALAQEHRLAIFRRLVVAGGAGETAGQLADAVGIAPQGLSFHVKELERAGLVTAVREGRFIRYALVVDEMRALLAFLSEDCCGGRPELCGALTQVPAQRGGASKSKIVCAQPRSGRKAHVKGR
ncbi:MAG: helix-turn-helix transcriptional regulator [Hyphomicrobiaceae bacterium]|nr:helix-turn-helix transcriptional regulator [Hyphomicrobiaceae bacterium]MCC0011474.1 helix-turn-helix transcriptional regulator [Hyphomicrobiaceae bacterium]